VVILSEYADWGASALRFTRKGLPNGNARSHYERDGVPLVILGMQLRPTVWAVDAVIEPRGDTRDDWKVVDEIAARMGLGGPTRPNPCDGWPSAVCD
jgi:hypothetical protein